MCLFTPRQEEIYDLEFKAYAEIIDTAVPDLVTFSLAKHLCVSGRGGTVCVMDKRARAFVLVCSWRDLTGISAYHAGRRLFPHDRRE